MTGEAYCCNCGKRTLPCQKQCFKCGYAFEGQGDDVWLPGTHLILFLVSVLLPLFGFIYGGVEQGKPGISDAKKQQAWQLIYAAILGTGLGMLFLLLVFLFA